MIELQPDNPEAYYNRGLVYDEQAKYNHAILDYTKVIELKPENATVVQ